MSTRSPENKASADVDRDQADNTEPTPPEEQRDHGPPLPSREEWMEFLAQEIEILDVRARWLWAVLAALFGVVAYLVTGVNSWEDLIGNRVLPSVLTIGLIGALWIKQNLLKRLRATIQPDHTFGPMLEAQLFPVAKLYAKGPIPLPVAAEGLLNGLLFGTSSALLWLLHDAGGAARWYLFLAVALLFGIKAFFALLRALLIWLRSIAGGRWLNRGVVRLMVYAIRTTVPEDMLSERGKETLEDLEEESLLWKPVEYALQFLEAIGKPQLITSQLGAPSPGVKRLLATLLSGGLLWGTLYFLAIDAAGSFSTDLLRVGLAAAIGPLIPFLFVALIKSPARELLGQLKAAVLTHRLDDREATEAHLVILSLEEIGFWETPKLMTLLVALDVIDRQRFLESVTYPDHPPISADELVASYEEDQLASPEGEAGEE